jgi:HPt (histidine-containing phosphotransfer) domain-containing protein
MLVPHSLDGFDVMGAVERMLGQPVLWWQAVGLFVEHYANWEAVWHACIGDDAQERKRVHAIRSAAVNVGAVRLSETAGELEDLLLERLAGGLKVVPDDLRQRLGDDFRQSWLAAANAWKESRLGPGGSA